MRMAEEKMYLHIPGHVPVKEAADMLGISEDRILQHIKSRRLPARKVDGRYMIVKEAVEQFKLNPPGRMRTKAPSWRVYNARSKLLSLDIQVQVRAGQQERLVEKLKVIQEEGRHTFPGTLARYVHRDDPAFTTVNIWLIWKDSEMPNETISERDLAAFKSELADVLDWDTAQYHSKEGIIYT